VIERGKLTDSGVTVAEQTAVDAANNSLNDADKASGTHLRLHTVL